MRTNCVELIRVDKSAYRKGASGLSKGKLRLGLDLGSVSSDVAALDEQDCVVYTDYRRTFGRPLETIYEQLTRLFAAYRQDQFGQVCITGSAGRLAGQILGIRFVNEVRAQAAAIAHLYPDFPQATVIEMGGQDSKLIFLQRLDGKIELKDFALNSVCAAGTGSFLDQQAERLGVSIENEFGRLALESRALPRMAGRCSVFAKSDMIHLQQTATPMCDIIAGLCLALARGLKSNLGCGREFVGPVIFTGGVAANAGVVRAFEEVFSLKPGELIVPQHHFFTGAMGAVLAPESRGYEQEQRAICPEKIVSYLESGRRLSSHIARREPLSQPGGAAPQNLVHTLQSCEGGLPEAYLGVDVGSISTNVVVIDQQNRVLAKEYLMTAGRPLEAVQQGLKAVGAKVGGRVRIMGAATTGSGRYLTGDFIGADVVINEITAQAAGAVSVCPEVDTIFEIGGQDSKYIRLENGVVVDFEMNHACAAGTGSFLEEQAQRLGISIKDEFAACAMKSLAPIQLGERCTVFIESDLLSYQQQGACTEDLVAGLSYSIVTNYLNRVVGRRKIGECICFQGGTAFNRAVWAAFEKVLGKAVRVPNHHEMTGAIGAAIKAAQYVGNIRSYDGEYYKSRFRGFEDVTEARYAVESFICPHCPNECEIKKVEVSGSEPLYYGSRCDRYNLRKTDKKAAGTDIIGWWNERLLECAGLSNGADNGDCAKGATVAIPQALVLQQLLPLFGRFFSELGCRVILSGKTTKATIQKGVESITAQPCFPVKAAFGHVQELLEKGADYLFIPSIVSMIPATKQNRHHQLCPYVQSFAYQVRSAFADKFGRTKLLSEPLWFGHGDKLMKRSLMSLAKKIGVKGRRAERAIGAAIEAQRSFQEGLCEKGRGILEGLGPNERLFILVSRPYNGLDEGLNLRLSRKLDQMGVKWMPMEMLPLEEAVLTDQGLHNKIYWSYGQKILRAAEIIARDRRLFAIYLSNFGCGPDSFLQTFFEEIMRSKPALMLEIDEHSADAGLMTRLEAFFESLRHYRDAAEAKKATASCPGQGLTCGHKLYIPYMGDTAYGLAACFRGYGQPAEVMRQADEKTLNMGRRFTTGKECLPCAVTLGEMLETLGRNEGRYKPAFFMPAGTGPCRFGMYNCLERLTLNNTGRAEVPIISPNQDVRFYGEFAKNLKGGGEIVLMKDMWTSVAGADLLGKAILRIRPYARQAQEAQEVYGELLDQWCGLIEGRERFSRLTAFMAAAAGRLSTIAFDTSVKKPRIGIVGEIYVRNHPFTNNHIIARLEKLGAACEMASLSEWVYYINFTGRCNSRLRGDLRDLFSVTVQDFVQHFIERRLAAPLEERFGKLTEAPIKELIRLAAPYIHHSFEGEAVLSVGKMLEFYHYGFGGMVNVMPFSCMPSTIVSMQTRRISADCGGMPILNISFDGQEDATMETRLEAFVEQVRCRQTASLRQLMPV